MDIERAFYRLNGLVCFGVAAHFLWSAGALPDASALERASEQELEALLRALAEGGFQTPRLMLPVVAMVSLMFAFYLHLHRRSRLLAMLALLSGTLTSALLLLSHISTHRLIALALQYVAAGESPARSEMLLQARRLFDLHLFHTLLVNWASPITYVLLGLLFRKSWSLLETLAGYLFLASAVLLPLQTLLAWLNAPVDLSAASSVPALAFLMAGIVLLRARFEEADELARGGAH